MGMPEPVTVEVPAEAENVQILRLMVMAGVGPDAGVDAVSDAGLAIDEAAALVLGVPGTSRITARIEPDNGSVAISVAGDARAETWPPPGFQGGLASDLLSALTRRVSFGPPDEPARVLLEL